jgi:hypothetical protein
VQSLEERQYPYSCGQEAVRPPGRTRRGVWFDGLQGGHDVVLGWDVTRTWAFGWAKGSAGSSRRVLVRQSHDHLVVHSGHGCRPRKPPGSDAQPSLLHVLGGCRRPWCRAINRLWPRPVHLGVLLQAGPQARGSGPEREPPGGRGQAGRWMAVVGWIGGYGQHKGGSGQGPR